MQLSDLKAGMRLPGAVTNITAFGAFVDIGVHQDGLVHVSELANHFVKDPATVVKVGQKVTVTVLAVDPARKRISLSMKSRPRPGNKKPTEKVNPAGKAAGVKRAQFKNKKVPFHNPFAEVLKGKE
jgi:uncharacterized protein